MRLWMNAVSSLCFLGAGVVFILNAVVPAGLCFVMDGLILGTGFIFDLATRRTNPKS